MVVGHNFTTSNHYIDDDNHKILHLNGTTVHYHNESNTLINDKHDNFSSVEEHIRHQEYVIFNPHLFPPDEDQRTIYGLVLPSFCLVSVLFNLFIFVVLFHKNKTGGVSSLSLLLQCLAWYDMCVSALSLWIYAAPTIMMQHPHFFPWSSHHYLHQIHPYLVPYLFPVLHMAITGSDYLNLAAAYERYIALDRFFKRRKDRNGCTPKSTWYYITAILLCTVAFNLPLVWERETVSMVVVGGENVTLGSHHPHNVTSLEVVSTPLRDNAVYIKLYRLTWEFLVFKATPWLSFLILFLSLQDRIRHYMKRQVRRTLSVEQYLEMKDSRIILGINALFYLTNALPLFISFCHILLFTVDAEIERLGNLMIVLNSTFKLFIYLALSHDFRISVKGLFVKDGYYWMAEEEKNKDFLGHAKVITFVQAR